MRAKNSLSSVFETLLSETVFGLFPGNDFWVPPPPLQPTRVDKMPLVAVRGDVMSLARTFTYDCHRTHCQINSWGITFPSNVPVKKEEQEITIN